MCIYLSQKILSSLQFINRQSTSMIIFTEWMQKCHENGDEGGEGATTGR